MGDCWWHHLIDNTINVVSMISVKLSFIYLDFSSFGPPLKKCYIKLIYIMPMENTFQVICIKYIELRAYLLLLVIHYNLFIHVTRFGYNTVLDITRFKDGSQKMYRLYWKITINSHFSIYIHFCLDYIENDHKWSFFNIIYTFLFGYNTVV